MALFGRVLEHKEDWKPRKYHERQKLLARTTELYEKEFRQPYLPSYLQPSYKKQEEEEEVIGVLDESMLSIGAEDLKKDTKWLPSMREYMRRCLHMEGAHVNPLDDEEFLEKSLKAYEEFFFSREAADEGNSEGGPPFHVDLFWYRSCFFPSPPPKFYFFQRVLTSNYVGMRI